MGIQISNSTLEKLGMTPDEFKIEIAIHLYDIGKMSMGQARKFAGIDQITLQKEMAKRDVYMKYTIDDFEDDLKTIEELEKLSEK